MAKVVVTFKLEEDRAVLAIVYRVVSWASVVGFEKLLPIIWIERVRSPLDPPIPIGWQG